MYGSISAIQPALIPRLISHKQNNQTDQQKKAIFNTISPSTDNEPPFTGMHHNDSAAQDKAVAKHDPANPLARSKQRRTRDLKEGNAPGHRHSHGNPSLCQIAPKQPRPPRQRAKPTMNPQQNRDRYPQ